MKLLCHINGDQDLLQAWLDYYTGIGVTSFHFIVHGTPAENAKLFQLTKLYPIFLEDQYNDQFTSEEKLRRIEAILANWLGQWILLVDSDEFVEFPYRRLSTTIRFLEFFEANVLSAPMVQRLRQDGCLNTPETIPDPFRHFPLCSLELYRKMGVGAATSKYPLFYRCDSTMISDGGNHNPPNGPSTVLSPMQGVTHHFKWRNPALKKMARRAESLHSWRHESAGYMAYLRCHNFTVPTADSFSYSRAELFRRGLLRTAHISDIAGFASRKILSCLPSPFETAARNVYRTLRRALPRHTSVATHSSQAVSAPSALISLVICTRNRCASLRACLEHVQHLETPGEWELVVVDNGSTDGTADLLKSFAERSSFRVVLVSEPKPGLGEARNSGIANSTGEIIAFTDDDCYVRSDFLIKILEVFKDERISFMGGRILLYDNSDLPITIRPDTEIQLIQPYSFIEAGELQGANMAVRRSLIARIGGFDPKFGKGAEFRGGEDMDLEARASQSGATGIYHPGPLVWHHHGRKSREDYNSLMKEYGHCRGAYYAKFILSPQTRNLFLTNWYRWTKSRLRQGQFLGILYEILGAAHYIPVHLLERMRSRGLRSQAGSSEQPQAAATNFSAKIQT